METIIEARQGTIKIVTYNKPKRKNAIDMEMYLQVTKILNDAAKDCAVSMMVLTGTGDYFSSGNDIIAVHKSSHPKFLSALHDFIEAFITFPKLLVAIVNGPAIGIAATTLPLCDLVFASENSFFYTPFTKLGLIAEGCSTYTFPRMMGYRKAVEMLVFNHKMPAREALEYGLVNYLYKPEELQSKVWDRLTEISEMSDYILTTSKKLMRGPIQHKLKRINDQEIATLNEIWATKNDTTNKSKL